VKNLVLDTHAFLWLLEGNTKLPASIRILIENSSIDLYLPALVVAEMVDLICKGKSRLDLPNLYAAIQSDARLTVVPMTEAIALATAKFATLVDIHDRCIMATTESLLQSIPDVALVTRDAPIRSSGLIPTLWD
jgi:PIN domain nuclease of toxin-antitoxin system